MPDPTVFTTLEQLVAAHSSLWTRDTLASAAANLDAVPLSAPYHAIPPAVVAVWRDIENRAGESARQAFQRALLLWLIERADSRPPSPRYTSAVTSMFAKSWRRIAAAAAAPFDENYAGNFDLYLKDLALCRQHLFPAGAQVVEQDSGFHRTLLLRGGFRQGLEFASFMLRERGMHRHYYQIHTHLLESEDFNPDGWDACYLRIAEMLLLHPEIRGMCGGSWFYDPALDGISPNLAYLRERPVSRGARLFYSEISINSGALAKSQSRRKLYEEGRYLPKSYVLIWPREAMLRWAEGARR